MSSAFDDDALRRLAKSREVHVLTTRPDDTQRRTIIWVVVDNGDVFVRSHRGDRGHWFQAALDRPDDVALQVGDQVVPVRAVVTRDDESIARCSDGLRKKYRRSTSLLSMLEPHVLHTTLRLDPR